MRQEKQEPETNLKGTFASVLIVGVIIVVMWVAVYLLYVAR
ncbi:cytochrome C oxidase subunit II [Planococcus faecalis]|uniref:Cytochrome C oxidase subunit II n=1 Tax=Planococcus faecalis TaxID=1598147 RepID=A0ABM6IW42_9BACL|nr:MULTISPECIES: cytochrome C oxidase subunit II [Planococcus]AQU80807.1 cytochrome C oxidase subunit II [Planococcus faecalis]MDJ0332025.1 cytochrome C oxidase subunit II [Planococcus sp. S3-L1]OHX55793.1 cytochrome C oxidase subunit II [Planococcus faecalis]